MKLIILAALALAAQAPVDQHSVNIETSNESAAIQAAERAYVIFGGANQKHCLSVRAGQLSRISVSPARNWGMEIYLYNADGKMVVCDRDASDGLSFRVHSGWQGPLTLLVHNTSRKTNLYTVEAE